MLHSWRPLTPRRLYAPRVQDQAANMRFLHLDSPDALQAPVPPFGIREPRPTYGDGRQRDDVLLVRWLGGWMHYSQPASPASRVPAGPSLSSMPLGAAAWMLTFQRPICWPPRTACLSAQIDEPLELVVMPGLAFDSAGRRLGRGGGYYDKFASAARRRAEQHGWAPPLLVALAFRCQVVQGGGGGGEGGGGGVPMEPHDASVDVIVTADGVIACSPAGAAAVAAAEQQQQ